MFVYKYISSTILYLKTYFDSTKIVFPYSAADIDHSSTTIDPLLRNEHSKTDKKFIHIKLKLSLKSLKNTSFGEWSLLITWAGGGDASEDIGEAAPLQTNCCCCWQKFANFWPKLSLTGRFLKFWCWTAGESCRFCTGALLGDVVAVVFCCWPE